MGEKQAAGRDSRMAMVELAVVLGVVVLLTAIAVRVVANAGEGASERRAQANLRSALLVARQVSADTTGRFELDDGLSAQPAPLDASAMNDVEATLDFVDDASAVEGSQIGVVVPDASHDRIVMWTRSGPDAWFGIVAESTGVVHFCEGSSMAAVTDPDSCTAARW